LFAGSHPGCKKDQRILADWCDPTGSVHHPYDVLIAQEQNLGWDARLRRRYATWPPASATGIRLASATPGRIA
jgi:hypothetical protein